MTSSRTAFRLGHKDLLFLAVILAVIQSFGVGYRFGSDNQVAFLAPIYRLLDPSFAPGDFFLRDVEVFTPRHYLIHGIALLARAVSLPGAILFLSLSAKIGLTLFSALAARAVFSNSNAAGLAACVLVLGLSGFRLGGASHLHAQMLTPHGLAMPVALLALWSSFYGRPLLAVIMGCAGSLIHPLLGLESAALSIGISLVRAAVLRDPRTLVPSLAATLGLAVFTWIFWIAPFADLPRAGDQQIIEILAFRAPHHYLPSTMPWRDYADLFLFLVAFLGSWWLWRRDHQPAAELAFAPPIFAALVVVAGFLGWLLVEVVPTRLALVAQTFRLFSWLKWMGWIWIGGTIGILFERGRTLFGALSLFIVTQLGLSVHHDRFPLFILASCGLLAVYSKHLVLGRGLALAGALVVVSASVFGPGPFPIWPERIARHRAQLTLSDIRGPVAELAKEVVSATPKNAVFAGPPDLDQLRLISGRAIVVGEKTMSFSDQNSIEWMRRARVSYGPIDGAGYSALASMRMSWRSVTDSHLLSLVDQVGASHAVLYRETPTRLLTVCETQAHRVVRLVESATSAEYRR